MHNKYIKKIERLINKAGIKVDGTSFIEDIEMEIADIIRREDLWDNLDDGDRYEITLEREFDIGEKVLIYCSIIKDYKEDNRVEEGERPYLSTNYETLEIKKPDGSKLVKEIGYSS